MKKFTLKGNIFSHFPYVFVAFISLMPLFPEVKKLNNFTTLYVIYFFLITSTLYLFPAKKLISIILILPSITLITYKELYGKELGFDDLSSLLDSNLKESTDFILSSNNYIMIVVPLSLLLIFIISISFKNSTSKKNKYFSYVLLAASLASLLIHTTVYSNTQYPASTKYPIVIYKHYLLYKTETSRISDSYKKFDNEKIYNTRHSDINIHLIIGESSRKDHYGICNGYKKDATPFLNKLSARKSFIPFCNTKSVALNTRYSVTSMLATKPVKDFSVIHNYKNIVHVFNNFGFKTRIFENNSLPQHKNDINKSLVLSNFIPANEIHFSKRTLDLDFIKDALPVINSEIGTLNIIHLRGNHIQYNKTYPKDFLADTKETDYYKSIRYTDQVLSHVIADAEKSDKKVIIFYLSDHGEYVNDFSDGLYGHGVLALRKYDSRKEVLDYLTDIPFFVYANKKFIADHEETLACLRIRKNSAISQDNIASTLLGIIKDEAEPEEYNESYDLCSENFVEHKRFVYNSDINRSVTDREQFIGLDE